VSTAAYELLASLPVEHGRWGDSATDDQRRDALGVLDADGAPFTWLGRPRGGRKTTDGAGYAVSLHLTVAPPGSRSYVVAADALQKQYPSGMYFHVPTEPLTSVLMHPNEEQLIEPATITAVNVALWVLGWFNQLVEEQTIFYGNHAVDLIGKVDDIETRERVAKYAREQSLLLHEKIIGNRIWYNDMINALKFNIKKLDDSGRQRWWQELRPRDY